MTANEVIQQIKALPPEEKAKVVDFITKELPVRTLSSPAFEQAAQQTLERHAELMRKLGQ